MTNQTVLKGRYHFADKGSSSQSHGFSTSHVQIWELDHKEGWVTKNWMLLNCGTGEDSWEFLGQPGDQNSHPKGTQLWIYIGRTDAEAEAPILWPPDAKSWLIGKDPDAGKDWGQGEKGMVEDEIVGWYHQLNGHEFEQTPGDRDGQGSLACCNPWGC